MTAFFHRRINRLWQLATLDFDDDDAYNDVIGDDFKHFVLLA